MKEKTADIILLCTRDVLVEAKVVEQRPATCVNNCVTISNELDQFGDIAKPYSLQESSFYILI
jgi:hypothetical protein